MSDETTLDEEQVVASFRDLAKTCRENTNPEDIYDRFEEALKLMLDARGMTSEDIAGSEAEAEAFIAFGPQFARLLKIGAYEQAAFMLLPTENRTGPGYFGGHSGGYYRTHIDTTGYDEGKYVGGAACVIEHPISSGGGPLVTGYGATIGLAMLIATLLAHAEWRELWRNGGRDRF
jgi:hypothetical protein